MTSVIKVDTIQSAAGSTVLEQTNATTITLGLSGQTVTVPSGATLDASNATLSGFATVNGITEADQWRLNANKTSNAVFSSNLERVDTDGYGQLGTGMTESSGNFTFPSTGIYLIDMVVSSDNQTTTGIYTTTDDSSYDKASEIYSDSSIQSGNCKFIFDVTNTSTHKVQFQKTGGGGTVYGTTAHNQTHFTFIRLGDT